jgi:hypothetical protein
MMRSRLLVWGGACQGRNLQISRWVHLNGFPCNHFTETRLDLVLHLFRDQLDGSGGCRALVRGPFSIAARIASPVQFCLQSTEMPSTHWSRVCTNG